MSTAEPKPRVAVITFPGSNDDQDAALALTRLGAETVPVWHADRELPDVRAVVLPGGFSYGDYLRAGALARFAPVMDSVRALAADGGLVLGICNGFQVLCEAGLLPGALRPNHSLSFVCRDVPLTVELKLEVHDSPNSAGVIIDAVRCAKIAMDRGIGGPLLGPSAYFMKSPPVQYRDEEAHRMVEAYAAGTDIK